MASITFLRRGMFGFVLLVIAFLPNVASATITPTTVNAPQLSSFSQLGALNGTLTTTTKASKPAFHATYNGSGSNGYARGIQNINWSATDNVWYGAYYYLPPGYRTSLKGGNDILRWDTWGADESNAHYGGIELWSDGKARLLLGKYTNDPGIVLGSPFALPEGRWFQLQVHQRFSTGSAAQSVVFINGKRVMSSTKPNTFGHGADRLRAGIVSISDGRQTKPLQLWFDHVRISTHQ